jgi:hypothetical protein
MDATFEKLYGGADALKYDVVKKTDFDHAEGFGAGVKLTRTQTIMQGASHCNFRYRLEERKRT